MTISPEGSWSRSERAPSLDQEPSSRELFSDTDTRATSLDKESGSTYNTDARESSLPLPFLSLNQSTENDFLDLSGTSDIFSQFLDARIAAGIETNTSSNLLDRQISSISPISLDRLNGDIGQGNEISPVNVMDNAIKLHGRIELNVPDQPKIDDSPAKTTDATGGNDAASEINNKAKALFAPDTSEQDRLQIVRELAKAGVTNLNVQGENGESLSLRLESVPVANSAREMVHLFIKGEGQKERVVLRGIAKENGSFEQQRNPKGSFVSYFGSGKETFQSLKPASIEPIIDVRPPDGRDYRPDSNRPDRVHSSVHRMFERAAEEAGRAGKLINTSQGVYLRSNFDVDVDGSPRAREIDPDGQRKTSWSYSERSNHPWINAEEVPYIVLPKGKYQEFGIKLGDYALVRDKASGKVAVAVFADVGPGGKTGEGSINLGQKHLGLDISPTRGISENRFEYLVFPGSSEGQARNQQELLARIDSFKERVGLNRPEDRSVKPEDSDRSPSDRQGDRSRRSIVDAALDSVGKAMWRISDFRNSVRGGRWGCAAAVSEVLQQAGHKYANHAGVAGLVDQLAANGWTRAPLSQAEPGDVVIRVRRANWRQGGGGSHIGIVGEDGKAYHNSSSKRVWVDDTVQARFSGGLDRWVMKPPKNR